MIPCVNFLVLLVGRKVLDFVEHEINLVYNESLHLWKIFLAC